MDPVLDKNGNEGAKGHADNPVPKDLPELDIKIVPYVDHLPVEYR
jgi:hypothetical protein